MLVIPAKGCFGKSGSSLKVSFSGCGTIPARPTRMRVCSSFVLFIVAVIQVWLSKAYEQPDIENGNSVSEEGELKYNFPSFCCGQTSLIVLFNEH